MARIMIVNQRDDELGNLLNGQISSQLIPDFSTIEDNDTIIWLPSDGNVDQEVFKLIDEIDNRGLKLNKIVMLSIAGVNDEVPNANLTKIWGMDAENLVLDFQYAVKMIDELELPYTIVRTPKIVKDETTVLLSNEGEMITGIRVNIEHVTKILADASVLDKYLNQSIGVSE